MSAALAGFEAIAASSSKHYSEPGRDLNLMSKPERRGVFRFCAAADHLDASMAALNKGLAAAELPEEPSLFLSRAEHDAAIEALRESREGREGEILLDPRSKRSNALR